MKAIALALLLTACASGRVIMNVDGSCTVQGIALGRAELVAYRASSTENRSLDEKQESSSSSELCAKVGGGAGSSSFWGVIGAAFGAWAGAGFPL